MLYISMESDKINLICTKEGGVYFMDGAMFIGTWWSLVPPLLAIILALVTKEVYSSLFIGVAFGALLYTVFIHGMPLSLFLIS